MSNNRAVGREKGEVHIKYEKREKANIFTTLLWISQIVASAIKYFQTLWLKWLVTNRTLYS